MPGRNREVNPTAFIGIGVCFMGAGVALSAALTRNGAGGVGIGLIGVGVVFLIIGLARKREVESGQTPGEDDDRPPA